MDVQCGEREGVCNGLSTSGGSLSPRRPNQETKSRIRLEGSAGQRNLQETMVEVGLLGYSVLLSCRVLYKSKGRTWRCAERDGGAWEGVVFQKGRGAERAGSEGHG